MEQPQAGQGRQEEWSRRRAVEESSRRLDRLSPLLHDLITWDLVYRTESGAFLLRDDVQRRLAEASARQARSAPELYVGRSCQRCGASGVTRLVEGARLCGSCIQAATVDQVEHLDARASRRRGHGHGHHDGRSWWSRKAG